jgi:hypothetical protein
MLNCCNLYNQPFRVINYYDIYYIFRILAYRGHLKKKVISLLERERLRILAAFARGTYNGNGLKGCHRLK